MSGRVDLTEMERRTYMAYHEDGLWDLVLGLSLLGFGVSLLLDLTAFAGISPALTVPIILALKERITYPRLGHANWSPEQRSVERMQRAGLVILIGLVVLVLLGLMALLLVNRAPSETQAWLRANFMPVFGAGAGLVLALLGLVSGIRRFLVYALVALLTTAGAQLLGLDFPVTMVVLGGMITLVALLVLLRFIRRCPRPSESDTFAAS